MFNYSNPMEVAESESRHYNYLFSLANREIEETFEEEEIEEVKSYAERYIIVYKNDENGDEFTVLGQEESIELTLEEADRLTNILNEKYGSDTIRYECFLEVYEIED